jgi:hypothetical protein
MGLHIVSLDQIAIIVLPTTCTSLSLALSNARRYKREEYVVGRQEKWLVADGNQVKYVRAHGKMTERNFIHGSQFKAEATEEEAEAVASEE